MAAKNKISRRKFIVRSLLGGTGILVGAAYLGRYSLRRSLYQELNSGESPYLGSTGDPMIWFEISTDNIITLYSPKVEMGQGTFTSLAQITADELDVNIEQIRVQHAASISGNLDEFSTGGSTSVNSLWQPLRELSATMREMIKNEAAKKMGLSVDQLTTKNATVTGGGKSMTYGEVVTGVDTWEIPDTPPLRNIKDYKYVGKHIPRVDLQDKVYGEPIFGMDAKMPDMLYGSVVRSSLIGAKFKGADISKAEGMPGVVKVVLEDDFVGVVANTYMEAENAKLAIKANWETEKNWQTKDIEDMIKVGKGEPVTIQTEGDAEKYLSDESTITAEYFSPLGAHAQMEPNGAVAYVEKDKATIIMSTQVVKITRGEVAARLGLDDDQVNIIPTFLGGGFGRRLHTPNAVQAAVLSKAVGKPVKCYFNRKEEFQNDTFRPPTHHIMKGRLSDDGMITAIEHNVSSGDVMYGSALLPNLIQNVIGSDLGAWRGGMIQYGAIPNYRAISWRVKLPFATSWWRSLGLLANTFAIESFMDQLALKAGKNPIDFRLAHIQDDEAGKRLKKVIEAAAENGNYNEQVKDGIAKGFACSTDASTPAAHVVEVSIEDNEIKVHKVTCVIDPGFAVNPDQVKAQCEGSIIMGMSAAMFERMYVEDGALRPTIYGPYKMAMMKHAPKEIDVIILESGDKPGPVGEPPLGPIGAAIANAVFRLTGKRLNAMPLELA
ncbi:xanthine dehydrogenase family protein molybdopterin-binding subunit [Fulvivirga lutimaris]|uniref:xanthine dehydrogenase family protein molybdopterin-binding subunit n=1 Tax=Fulvivirga lutimaris TaxID=1819566 RepID=UPI0012BD5D9C|nr:molybdopterin cofactor-binding domain-containing protein [Fulvivirga lutimaris]MTI38844.1 xanthine dehydrogenase family protein molybdopterin-binding subunit [Fulvivirga lutimaris]